MFLSFDYLSVLYGVSTVYVKIYIRLLNLLIHLLSGICFLAGVCLSSSRQRTRAWGRPGVFFTTWNQHRVCLCR